MPPFMCFKFVIYILFFLFLSPIRGAIYACLDYALCAGTGKWGGCHSYLEGKTSLATITQPRGHLHLGNRPISEADSNEFDTGGGDKEFVKQPPHHQEPRLISHNHPKTSFMINRDSFQNLFSLLMRHLFFSYGASPIELKDILNVSAVNIFIRKQAIDYVLTYGAALRVGPDNLARLTAKHQDHGSKKNKKKSFINGGIPSILWGLTHLIVEGEILYKNETEGLKLLLSLQTRHFANNEKHNADLAKQDPLLRHNQIADQITYLSVHLSSNTTPKALGEIFDVIRKAKSLVVLILAQTNSRIESHSCCCDVLGGVSPSRAALKKDLLPNLGQTLSKLHSLAFLKINHIPISVQNFVAIINRLEGETINESGAPMKNHFRHLDISHSQIQGIESLQAEDFLPLSNLILLRAAGGFSSHKKASFFLDALPLMRNINHLNLSGNCIWQGAVPSLTMVLSTMQNLEDINLRYNWINYPELMMLTKAFQKLDKLSHINLAHNAFGGEELLEFYVSLKYIKKLSSLNLSFNMLQDYDISQIISIIPDLRAIKSISLKGNSFTSRGREYLGLNAEGFRQKLELLF